MKGVAGFLDPSGMTEQEELSLAAEMSHTATGRSEVVGNVGCLTVYCIASCF